MDLDGKAPPPRDVAGLIGVVAGSLAVAGFVAIVAVSLSMPKRAPTTGDFGMACWLFLASAVVAVTCLAGGLSSIVGLVVAASRKRSPTLSLAGLGLNLVPPVVGFAGDYLHWWTR